MENDIWTYIKKFIQSVLAIVHDKFDKESIDTVNHYVNHDEFEMAFEVLFIEVMKLRDIPSINFSEGEEIGKMLKLDEEVVFDPDFWSKFSTYIQKNNISK
jgi:hypothetical protein